MISFSYRLSVALLALLISLGSLQGQFALPYVADFEGSEGYTPGNFNGLGSWGVVGTGVSVSNQVFPPESSGNQSLFFPKSPSVNRLKGLFSGALPGSTTYVDFYLKPNAASFDSLPLLVSQPLSALVGLANDSGWGEIALVDGDGAGGGEWLLSNIFINLVQNQADSFHRYTLQTDGKDSVAFDLFSAASTHPLFNDPDNDGISTAYELSAGLNPSVHDRYGDLDLDSLENITEFMLATGAGPIQIAMGFMMD